MKAFFLVAWAWALLCFAAPPAASVVAAAATSSAAAATFITAAAIATTAASSDVASEGLLKMRIFFGHNSVGDDMLSGLKTALPKLRVVRSHEGVALGQPGFAHFSTDNNGKPLQKIEVFEKWLLAGLGKTAQLAFNKFCYMDFNAQTQVPALFKAYEDSIRRIEAAFPQLKVLHVTIPLKGTWDIHGNQKREQFNKLLRKTYGEKVFDLAKIQSTRPGGGTERTQKGDPALVKAYSDDDGHLNRLGQERVSQAFIPFLLQHGASL